MDKIIGKVGQTPKGEYNGSTIYEYLDVVSFDGSSYVSKINDNNQPLSNLDAWQLNAEKGGKGDKGDAIDSIIYDSLTEQQKQDIANRLDVSGKVNEGDTRAVSGGEVYDSVLKPSDLELENLGTSNKLDPSYIQIGKYIDANNNIISSGAQNVTIVNHPISQFAGQAVTFGGFTPQAGKKIVFRDVNGIVNTTIPMAMGALPRTIIIPSTAYTFDLQILRNPDTPGSYSEVRMNLGNTLLPYEPFDRSVIKKIYGYEIESNGGEAYDQSLNTTDDVEFNSVTTNLLSYKAIALELPQGNGTPPVGVEIGDAWLDTATSSVKVRLS